MYLKIIILFMTWISVNCSSQLPDDIEKCHFGDNKCILNFINQIIRRFGKGNPKIGLPPIDNIQVEDIHLLNSPGPLWISYKLKNQVLKGFENATVTGISGVNRDPALSKVEIKLRIPSLSMHGNYELQGRGIILYTNSSGTTKSDMQNVRITATIKFFIQYRYNKRYLNIYDVTPKFELDRWILTADNLFAENTDLTVILNRVINDNWLEFWNEIEPTILPAYRKSFANLMNIFTQSISYDDMFFPDKNMSNK